MKKTLRFIIPIAVALLLIAVVLCVALIPPPSAKEVFETSIQSVVELKAQRDGGGDSYGTAVIVKDDGTFVTNAHVVTYTKAGEVSVFEKFSVRFAFETEYRDVALVKYDLAMDIAVLKAEANFGKAIKCGNSDQLSFGDKVYAVGNGSNYGLAFTQGNISIPKLNIDYEGNLREVIQCDLTISAGNSGGALLDERGSFIGITTFRMKDSAGNVVYGIAYCLPVNAVMTYVSAVS